MTAQPALPGLDPPKTTRPKTEIPAWILEQAKANRIANKRTATFHRCRNCGALVLTGLDADTLAWTVTTDPTPIPRPVEVACILTNRRTFNAYTREAGYELQHRHPAHPPQSAAPILPEHRCGHRFPGFITTTQGARHEWPPHPTF